MKDKTFFMRKFNFSILMAFLLFGCSKSNVVDTKESEVSTDFHDGSIISEVLDDDAKKYTEYACQVGNCAGTKCDDTKGECKKKACTALPGACTRVVLTAEEIEFFATKHANTMLEQGYIEKTGYNRSKELAIQILKQQNQ